MHASASFVTLTYSDEFLPDAGSLEPRDLQLFLKRVRKHKALRFFAVGEYGDLSERPHYHVVMYGMSVEDGDLLQRCWGAGFVDVRELTQELAQYAAGYVVKKMTRRDDDRLGGRYPEFARMSLRPGIGAVSIPEIAEALRSRHGWDEISRTGDVPAVLSHGNKKLPLGRYLRKKLREQMEFVNAGGQDEAIYRQSLEMCKLYKDYAHKPGLQPLTLKTVIQEVGKQKIRNLEGRAKIYAKRSVL